MIWNDRERSSRGPWVLEVAKDYEENKTSYRLFHDRSKAHWFITKASHDFWPPASCVVVQDRKFCAGKLLIIWNTFAFIFRVFQLKLFVAVYKCASASRFDFDFEIFLCFLLGIWLWNSVVERRGNQLVSNYPLGITDKTIRHVKDAWTIFTKFNFRKKSCVK